MENIFQLWDKLLLPLIIGAVGALTATWLNLKVFRSQTKFQAKHQDDVRRRDSLRDILNITPMIYRNIYDGWNLTGEHTEDAKELILRLQQQITTAKSQFLDDEEITKALNLLLSLIGADVSRLSKSGVEPPDISIYSIEDVIKNRIRELEKILYA